MSSALAEIALACFLLGALIDLGLLAFEPS